jgi:hypothetical protein
MAAVAMILIPAFATGKTNNTTDAHRAATPKATRRRGEGKRGEGEME